MKKNSQLLIVLVCSISFSLSCGQPANTAQPNTANAAGTPNPSPIVSREPDGKELFALNCMICHKENGKGGKVTIKGKSFNADDLTTEKMAKMTDEKLIGYVTNGIEDEGMPSFKDKMTPEEIRAVIAHVRTLQAQ